MNIKKIIIQGLYGYINKEVEFNSKFNILVGINGSGKTSVLNLIDWVLKPSLYNLCTTEFIKIEIEFVYKRDTYRIVYKQNIKDLKINISNITKEKKFNTIQATFNIHPKEITRNPSLKDNLKRYYERLGPETSEVESWQFIFHELPKTIVIGLDRDFNKDAEKNSIFSNSTTIDDFEAAPLDAVHEIASKQHSLYNNNVINLNSKLRDKIMLSAFDVDYGIENVDNLSNRPNITILQVETLENKVRKYFQDNVWVNNIDKENHELTRISKYFLNLKNILNRAKTVDKNKFDILYWANANQFKKIKDLISEFEAFETKIKQYYQPLKEYIDTLNGFFCDSSKQLYFEPETSELKFNVLNKDGKVIKEKRDLKTLSSGELQILILFTILKFNESISNSKIIIIDEPELSLHPKWQEDFIGALEILTPDDTQIILATHSPLIVGDNKKYCKVLLPYN